MKNLLIKSKNSIFGKIPFVFYKKEEQYFYVSPLQIGEKCWMIPKHQVLNDTNLYIAAHDEFGISTIDKFNL